MINYTLLQSITCDKCPDNCLECDVVNSKLICKDGKCSPKYVRNSDKLCSKCPDNCVDCTWNWAKARTECRGTASTHFCIERENGRSWGLKNDGTCVPCPTNCNKCYFEDDSSPIPVCYPSMCQKKFTFDDETGTCVQCPNGCDYCKKRSTGLTCLACSENFAPKYGTLSTIESCEACSIANCDYCEIVSNAVQCMRSPCGNKSPNSNSKMFSFTSGTCSESCKDNTLCTSGSIVDENGSCFCRSCSEGSTLILFGPNAGVCKNCGLNCADCQLNSDKTDVECKTCIGSTQWVDIEIGGTLSRGCYDCGEARLQCKRFERFGSSPDYKCRCKANECIGDQTNSTEYTVFQESNTPSTPFQKCKACSEEFPNAVQCTKVSGSTPTPGVKVCQSGYEKDTGVIPTTCQKIGEWCVTWSLPNSVSTQEVTCTKCANGAFLNSTKCQPCPDRCSECIMIDLVLVCLACSNGNSGMDCASPSNVCDSASIDFCEEKWNMAPSGSTPNCYCSKCLPTYAANNFYSYKVLNVGSCTAFPFDKSVVGCYQMATLTDTLKCAKCLNSFVLTAMGSCLPAISSCKDGFSYAFNNVNASCNVLLPHHVKSGDIYPVPLSNQGGQQCQGYFAKSGTFSPSLARCSGCTTGYILDTSNPEKYECVACNGISLLNCKFAVVSDGTCLCGRCSEAGEGKHYLKHPIDPGCVEIADIANCNAYTMKLNEGVYIAVCSECSAGQIVAKNGLSCLQCGTCNGGINKLNSVGDACECTCPLTGSIINSDLNACIDCSSDKIANCTEFMLVNDICKCSQCAQNYIIKDDTECIDCESGEGGAKCIECNLAAGSSIVSSCTKCASGWALEPASSSTKPKCYQCQDGCEKCTVDVSSTTPSTINRCLQCTANYALNNAGECIKCPLNCNECRIDPTNQNSVICLSFGCASSRALKDSDFSCELCSITNCAICVQQINDSFTCLQCSSGYYKDNSGNCQACVEGCSFCLNGETCIPNGCTEGFIRHRTEGTCLPCTGAGVARCSFEAADSEILVPEVCKSGNTLTKSSGGSLLCERCDLNCKKCDVNGLTKCDEGQCNTGYFYDPTDKVCYQNKYGCLQSKRWNGETICSACDTAISVLSNGKCKNCPTGCSGCTFDMTSAKFSCASCKDEYYRTANNLCAACPTGCNTCLSKEGSVQCTSCKSNYGLNGEQCEPCNTDNCENCQTSSGSGSSSVECTFCAKKYYINSESCGQCPNLCQECSYNGKYECLICQEGTGRSPDGTCIPCPATCQSCAVNSDRTIRCIKCKSNEYSLQPDGRCRPCSEVTFANCATCSSNPFKAKVSCYSCNAGYSLQNDGEGCIDCSIAKCDKCIHGNICLECKSGFQLTNHNTECAQKCYECKGNEADCGNDVSNLKNSTSNLKVVDCSIGDCWAYRMESLGQVTFARGCSNETCTSATTNENCKTINEKKECVKCCSGDRCNTWALDGKAGAERIANIPYFIFLLILINILTTGLRI
ncbi:DgyrCDS14891 [Dimorphilus gyrociliatus]|uniref:DgyrCDS14891 n=1 Tax=Dimorphilus gyrociliatus TaxID=2664684 RepID=A0A7I8WFL8_9ANNE|nr:DgyrCDS14891 [Dimorphilus gyrociliatus]